MTINSRFTGEQRLLLEILKRAINDYLEHYNTCTRANGAELTKKAKRWLFAPFNCLNAPFTFAWICEHLEISPYRVQKNVRLLDEQLKSDPSSLSKRLTTVTESEMEFLSRYYGDATEDMFDVRLWC